MYYPGKTIATTQMCNLDDSFIANARIIDSLCERRAGISIKIKDLKIYLFRLLLFVIDVIAVLSYVYTS